ncbi:MAG: hypothetical protein K5695_10205 [Oscillospiraceae bacterium]|nr:hypothetical protein [Oscillospiraceae bacterium]
MTPEEKFDAMTGGKRSSRKESQTGGEFMRSLTGMYRLSPDAEERFSKSFIQNTKGTVRVNLLSLGVPFVLFFLLGVVLKMLSIKLDDIANTLLLIAYLLSVILFFWSKLAWRLRFDGSTGFIQYHTLFGGTKTYHVSELMAFDTQFSSITNAPIVFAQTRPRKLRSEMFRRVRTISTSESIRIHTGKELIIIPLASSWHSDRLTHGIGGYVDAEKLYTYLDMYRRYCYSKENDPAPAPPAEESPAGTEADA